MPEQPHLGHASHVDRADPDGSFRASIDQVSEMRNPAARALAIALGMPAELLDRMYETSSELRQLLTGYERWSPVTRLGWAITGVANPATYDRAVQCLENGQPDAAEDVLEEYWNQEGKLETLALRVLRTAICSDVRMSTGRERHRLVKLAVEDHRAGRYHASVPVVLAQTEGMLRDAASSSPFGNTNQLVDEVSQGGHPDVLKVIFDAGRRTAERTSLQNDAVFPLRHGILHGRLLAYDNRRNSTKALVAMAELATVCQARIHEAYDSGTLEELDRKVF